MQNNQNNDTVFYYYNTMDKTTIDYKRNAHKNNTRMP